MCIYCVYIVYILCIYCVYIVYCILYILCTYCNVYWGTRLKSRPAHHLEEVYCIVERAFKFSGFSKICTFMQFFEAKLTHNGNIKSLKIVMLQQRKREGPAKGPQSILSWSWNWWGDRGMPWDKVLQMPAKHSRLPAWKCRAEQFILNFSKLGLTNTVVSCCKTILQKAFGWNVQKVPPLLDYIQKHCIGDDDVNLSPPSNSK